MQCFGGERRSWLAGLGIFGNRLQEPRGIERLRLGDGEPGCLLSEQFAEGDEGDAGCGAIGDCAQAAILQFEGEGCGDAVGGLKCGAPGLRFTAIVAQRLVEQIVYFAGVSGSH